MRRALNGPYRDVGTSQSMSSSLLGRLGAFCVGFGLASVLGAKLVVEAVHKSNAEIATATSELAARVKVLEKAQGN